MSSDIRLETRRVFSNRSPSPSRRGTEIEEPNLSSSFSSEPRPPLLVKLTAYRLLTIVIIASFGTAKALKSLEGGKAAATWLDWVLGVVLGTMLYWLGLYESIQPAVAVWFFHTDLARDTFYLSFGIVIASSYCMLALSCFMSLMPLCVVAWFMLPFPEHIGEPWNTILLTFWMVPFVLMMILSLLAALFLPFLAGGVIIYTIGLFLMLGGSRFKRRVTRFFLTGYRNRYAAAMEVYFIMTLFSSVAICWVIFAMFPLFEWLPKPQFHDPHIGGLGRALIAVWLSGIDV